MSNELQLNLVRLLEELGMFSQAQNASNDPRYQSLDTLGLAHALKKFGIFTSIQKADKTVLLQAHYPMIVVPEDKPAFILRRRNNHFEILSDSKSWLSYELSEEVLNSHVFIVESIPSTGDSVKAFSKQMSKRTKWYKPVFWLSFVASLSALAVPLFTMSVYDRVIGGQAPEALPKIALGAFLAIGILIGSRLVRAQILSSTSNRFARDLADITFSRLLNMPLLVLSRVGVTNHISRMRNAEKVRALLSGPGGAGLVDMPFALIALTAIGVLSGWLVLVPILMLVLFFLVNKLLNRFAQNASPTITGIQQDAVNEFANNILQLKASGNAESWKTKLARILRENAKQNFIFAKRNGLNTAVAHSMSMYTALVTVFIGIFLVLEQSISPGALIACVMLIWRITGPAQFAVSSSQKFNMLRGSIEQFDRFMQAETEHDRAKLDIVDIQAAPKISFNHVTLRYSGNSEPALSGVSFDILPGEHVAVIGPNGSGKSTLLMATLGVIEPQAGFVTVNDKNLKQFDPEIYRNYAAFSASNPDIFDGSLRDNIVLGTTGVNDDDIVNAIDAAGGRELFKAMNNDLDTKIMGTGSYFLSAVEASYISLARAFLKRSTLLILDEPNANRNPFAKRELIKTLRSLKGNTTVLFSSHDQELIKNADKVIVMDKGAVAYAGPMPDSNKSQ